MLPSLSTIIASLIFSATVVIAAQKYSTKIFFYQAARKRDARRLITCPLERKCRVNREVYRARRFFDWNSAD